MKLFVVIVREELNHLEHSILVNAFNSPHAKNIGESKWYELNPKILIDEERTLVWEIEKDFSNGANPSQR